MRQWDPQSRLSLQLGRLFRFGRTHQAACAQYPALIFCPLLSCFSIHCSTWTKILHTERSTETCEIWHSSRDNDHAMVGSKAWETDGIISSNPPYCSNPLAYKIQSCVHYKVICFPDASHCFPISSRTSICSSLQKKFNSFLMSTTCCAHQGCHSCFGSPLQTQSARSVFCRRSKQCQPLQLEWVPDEVQLKNLARAIMMQVLEVPVVPDDSQACPVDISTVPDESLSPQRGKRTSHVTGWLGWYFSWPSFKQALEFCQRQHAISASFLEFQKQIWRTNTTCLIAW